MNASLQEPPKRGAVVGLRQNLIRVNRSLGFACVTHLDGLRLARLETRPIAEHGSARRKGPRPLHHPAVAGKSRR